MNSKISFAVYDSPILPEQESNQLINRSALYDRLGKLFERIDTARLFGVGVSDLAFSRHGNLIGSKAQLKLNEALELYWLTNLVEKFLESPNDFLLVVNSASWLPDKIDSFLEAVISECPANADFISLYLPEYLHSIWTEASDSECMLSRHLVIHDPVVYLFTRKGARRFQEIGQSGFSSGLRRLVFGSSSLDVFTVRPGISNSPSVFSDLFTSIEKVGATATAILGESFHIDGTLPRQSNGHRNTSFSTYISHWYATTDSVVPIVRDLRSLGIHPVVINTTEVSHPEYLSFPTLSFFDQFEYACASFDTSNEYMLFLTADVSASHWDEFLERSRIILGCPGVGAYSPALTFDLYNYGGTEISRSTSGDLALVNVNDAICIFMHRDIVSDFNGFFKYFRSHRNSFDVKIGWGIPVILQKSLEMRNLLNIKDRSFIVHHPASRSYSSEEAREEMNKILRINTEFFDLRAQARDIRELRIDPMRADAHSSLDSISRTLSKTIGV